MKAIILRASCVVLILLYMGFFLAGCLEAYSLRAAPPRQEEGEKCKCQKAGHKCDCGKGKDCDCVIALTEAEADAYAWVAGSPVEKEFMPETFPADVRRAVEKICLEHGLWHDKQPWQWPADHRDWMIWANNSWQRMYADSHLYPPLRDCECLPSMETAERCIRLSRDHATWLSGNIAHNDFMNGGWAIVWEINNWTAAWEHIRDAQDTTRTEVARRRSLANIVNCIGLHNYGACQWPPVYHEPAQRR